MASDVEVAIQAARQRLKTARFGLSDLETPERAMSGLYNAVVFGRMVTFALQNMRGKVEGFDDWYQIKQEEMKASPLLKYFSELRTKIEKQVGEHAGRGFEIKNFDDNAMRRLLKHKPEGASSFFMGDGEGRSGWLVKAADGSEQAFYINLPKDIGGPAIYLAEAPVQYRAMAAEKVVAIYLDKLEQLIEEAKEKFQSD
jgi:hypothetical protein